MIFSILSFEFDLIVFEFSESPQIDLWRVLIVVGGVSQQLLVVVVRL